MKQLVIDGGETLSGSIRISGAKNSAVALIPAALLASDTVTICNVPDITDIDALSECLKFLGASVRRASESMVIDPSQIENKEIPEHLAKKLRASYYFMGALLGKYHHVEMHFPGGCSIGKRPINLHLKGFEALGATVSSEDNKYVVDAEELRGANIYLDIASVGATINIMLAAVLAKGDTVIDNAAKEPEIVNVATFLNNMGASISGAGTSTIKIHGVSELHGCYHEVIPDRIEAGTYAIIAALTGNYLKIDNLIPEHIDSLLSKFDEIGVYYEVGSDYVIINHEGEYRATNITTAVYPGFPTDLQQPFSILLTKCKGTSKIQEKIFENRFMHIPYVCKMGADCNVEENTAEITGISKLHGEEVVATDLRAGAALVVAGLIADGTTRISNAEHILRGYENIVEKLSNVGAKIRIEEK